MSTFGAPQFGEVVTQSADPAPVNGQTVADQPVDIIDPNDPRLMSEPLDVNPDADAYAQPAPPPDGKYRAKLKLEPIDEKDQALVGGQKRPYRVHTDKNGAPSFEARISAQIIDPSGKHEGITVYPEFGGTAGTMVQQRTKSSKVATILARLKRPDGSPWLVPGQLPNNHGAWIELFVQALAGEPEIGIETEWQASCQACGEAAKKAGSRYPQGTNGMHRFPAERDPAKRKEGQLYDPEVPCAAVPAHGYARAQARITGFMSLAELTGKK